MMQAKAAHLVKDIWEMRQIIANSLELVKYEPTDQDVWDQAFQRFQNISE